MANNNYKPTSAPTAGYIGINRLAFAPPPPHSIGIQTAIPKTNNGNTSLSMFSKVTNAMKSPWTKKVISTQMNRL